MELDEFAASRRADYVRALQEERRGYEVAGRADRVAEVDAELARVQGGPVGRSESPTVRRPKTTRKA